MNISGSKFVPGPLPKHSLAPRGPDALYSGLLECPLTDKVVKTIPGGEGFNDSFLPKVFTCPSNSSKPTSNQHIQGYTIDSWPWPVYAFGATADTADTADTEELNLFWNPGANGGDHWLTFGAVQAVNATNAGYTLVRKIGAAPTAKSVADKKAVYLHYSASRMDHFTSAFSSPPRGYVSMGLQGYLLDAPRAGSVTMAWYTSPEATSWGSTSGDNVLTQDEGTPVQHQCKHLVNSADQCFGAAKKMQGIGNVTVQTSSGASDSLPSGCTVNYAAAGVVKAFYNTKQTDQCCGDGVDELSGNAHALVDLKVIVSSNTDVKITLTGPSTVWFGVGFFAQSMVDAPYTIVVDGTGAVSERRIANHAIGRVLLKTVSVISNTVVAGVRTVVLSRSAEIPGTDYANFSMAALNVPFISAIGSTPALSYHKLKTAAALALWPSAGQSVCLCSQPAAPFGSASGTIKYLPTGEEFGFTNFWYVIFGRIAARDTLLSPGLLQGTFIT